MKLSTDKNIVKKMKLSTDKKLVKKKNNMSLNIPQRTKTSILEEAAFYVKKFDVDYPENSKKRQEILSEFFSLEEKRSIISLENRKLLNKYLLARLENPYPSKKDKHWLVQQTGLKRNQITNYYTNIRRRNG